MDSIAITKCRVCGNNNLIEVLDLGVQELTGFFPASKSSYVPEMPLKLVKCHGQNVCHLLQLSHTFDLDAMYGENYGYRSGLNDSMVAHLAEKVATIESMCDFQANDIVLDIGSNDGTTLKSYSRSDLRKIGIDPTGQKFASFYPSSIELIPDFFSAILLQPVIKSNKAKVITSFSMFYDLPSPVDFVKDIAEVLDENGIWVLEQSYMPEMMNCVSYDTVCHEHLEYYGLRQIKWIVERAGLQILDIDFNKINGGSFSVTVAHYKKDNKVSSNVQTTLDFEKKYSDLLPYQEFQSQVQQSRAALKTKITEIAARGESIFALGASTKGNVILQYCGLNSELLSGVAEVNEDKYGRFTPGTRVPILSETDVLEQKPDNLLVLPWHFKAFFESSDKFIDINLIYPLQKATTIDD